MELENLWSTTEDREVKEIVGSLLDTLAAQSCRVEEIVHVFLVEPSDTNKVLKHALGYSPLVNRWTGIAYNQAGFDPFWEYFKEHDKWYEMVCVLSDDGFGHLIIVPKGVSDSELDAFCAANSKRG